MALNSVLRFDKGVSSPVVGIENIGHVLWVGFVQACVMEFPGAWGKPTVYIILRIFNHDQGVSLLAAELMEFKGRKIVLWSPVEKIDFSYISFWIQHLDSPLDIILLCQDIWINTHIVHGATVTTVPTVPATILGFLAHQLLLEFAFDVAEFVLHFHPLNVDVFLAFFLEGLAVEGKFFVDFGNVSAVDLPVLALQELCPLV